MTQKHNNNPFKKDQNEETINEQDLAQENENSSETSDKNTDSEGNDELSALQAKYDELNNQYIRLAADFDNYRKRQAQERESLLKYGAENALKKMLEVTIDAQGQIFDPNFHEAVMQTPTSEHPEHTIIAELQKGYKMGDKVLRPSLVNVATAEN